MTARASIIGLAAALQDTKLKTLGRIKAAELMERLRADFQVDYFREGDAINGNCGDAEILMVTTDNDEMEFVMLAGDAIDIAPVVEKVNQLVFPNWPRVERGEWLRRFINGPFNPPTFRDGLLVTHSYTGKRSIVMYKPVAAIE